MKLNKVNSLITIAILVIVLTLGGCTGQESSKSVIEQPRPQAPLKKDESAFLTGIGVGDAEVERSLPDDIYGREDPFAPVDLELSVSSKRKSGELKLDGLISGTGQPLAMVNDRIVKEGDIIEDKKVVKIGVDSIILQDREGQEYILRLF
jgi:hypothetical protein